MALGCKTSHTNDSGLNAVDVTIGDNFKRTVSKNRDDDIAVIKKTDFQTCNERVDVTAQARAISMQIHQYKLEIYDAFYIEIRQRIRDRSTVTKDEVWHPKSFQRLIGYETKVIKVPEVVPEKFDTSVFFVNDVPKNHLILDDIMNAEINIVSYTYDRSRFARWGDNVCADGERRFARLKSITVEDSVGNVREYKFAELNQ